ncbi:MAG: hypothetical protein GXP49_08165 [Deltaproteobacteria bacterium]|nr:hypothetical protein [Deltaproteobacteria bacterium]
MIVLMTAFSVLVLFVIFVLWASRPSIGKEISDCPVVSSGSGNDASKSLPSNLKVMTFNIAYGRGPVDDIGDLREKVAIQGFLDKIAFFIRNSGVDLAALQEVDFDSHRTWRINEAEYLAKATGLSNYACVTTWHNRYIPYPYWPPNQHYGRMHSGQCVLSRFPLEHNMRYLLPQPGTNSLLYNLFYLHRAIQQVDVSLGPSGKMRIFNVHLEAFNIENRMLQARMLTKRVASQELPLTLVLGDFNSIPPEAPKKNGFPDEPGADFRGDSTIQIMRNMKGFSEAIETFSLKGRTGPSSDIPSLTFPSQAPSRRLDYLFYSLSSMKVITAGVDNKGAGLSDHLPIIAELKIR